MSQAIDYGQFDHHEDVFDAEEAEELETALAEVDAHPEWNIPWDEFTRRFRSGE